MRSSSTIFRKKPHRREVGPIPRSALLGVETEEIEFQCATVRSQCGSTRAKIQRRVREAAKPCPSRKFEATWCGPSEVTGCESACVHVHDTSGACASSRLRFSRGEGRDMNRAATAQCHRHEGHYVRSRLRRRSPSSSNSSTCSSSRRTSALGRRRRPPRTIRARRCRRGNDGQPGMSSSQRHE